MAPLREARESFSNTTPGVSFQIEDAGGRSNFTEQSVQAKLSGSGLTFTTMLSIIGTTVLGISAQMQKAGWILGPLTLCLGCGIIIEMTWLVCTTIDGLLAKGDGIKISSYPEYAQAALGPGGSALAAFTSTLAPLGMICNGLIISSNNMELMFADSLGWSYTTWACILTITTAIYAYFDLFFGSLARLLGFMEIPSWVANAWCIIFAWIGIYMGSRDAVDIPEACRTDTEGHTFWSVGPNVEGEHMMGGVLQLAAVASYGFYCFAVVVSLPKFHSEMENPKEVVRSSSVAYVICTVLFLSIMLPGYHVFGNWGPKSIISAMTVDRPDGWWAFNLPWETGTASGWGYAFSAFVTANLLMTDGIYVPVCVNNLEGAYVMVTKRNLTIVVRIVIRAFVVLLRTLVATWITSFLVMTGLTSSLFCICNNILMPIVGFYRTEVQEVSPLRKALHVLIFCFGFFCVICGTAAAIYDMQQKSDEPTADGKPPPPGSFVQPSLTEACLQACAAALKKSTCDPTSSNLAASTEGSAVAISI
mmetsp:Transcript_27363/g.59458  ORF Transcript_27363/g.59458 Transcript_27363/m.59458 type:complete len:533 (+) Transcript_27363:484-2082(+)